MITFEPYQSNSMMRFFAESSPARRQVRPGKVSL
jgi:hypothetical protein